MQDISRELKKIIKGDIYNDARHINPYVHDASIYEITPEALISPRDVSDIKKIINFIHQRKSSYPNLSITPRGAGTDMSGGALSDSLILDFTKYFDQITKVASNYVHAQPGVYLRSIDPLLEKQGSMLGCAPASRAYCTIGGVVANNSAGEQSLRYGNADKNILELKAVLADGKEYTFKPINKQQLNVKMKQKDFEGYIYKKVYRLIEDNYDTIKNARPKSTKNSMGYNLWSTWDRETGVFDMTQLFTGSQGTLGIITDIKLRVLPQPKHTGLLVMYLRDIKDLGKIINIVMKHRPATFEGFDDVTFGLGIKYFRTFRKQLGAGEWLKQQIYLTGSVAKFRGHLPNLVLMAEFEGDDYSEVNDQIVSLRSDLLKSGVKIKTEIAGNEEQSSPFWKIRRASLSLLRQRIKDKYPSAFMDDLAVPIKFTPKFLPEVRRIIRKYKLPATIAGHFGDGNFHIIPLMDITNPKEQLKFEPAMRELVPIVLKYGGTLAGEHNDGLIRGPWLRVMFGEKVYELFKDVKEIFDPMYIFNPNKKTDASIEYSNRHIRSKTYRNLYK